MGVPRNRSLLVISIVLVACCSQCVDGLRILGLFPLHGKSHFSMCESLMKGLAAKGHQVDVYSHFPQKKPVPRYTDYSLDGTLPAVVNNITYDYIQRFDSPNIKFMMEELANKVCELMSTSEFQKLFQRLEKNQPYDVVIMEVFVSNCYLAWGRFLKIPMVGVMTSSLIDWYNEPLGNPLNLAVTPSSWSHLYHPMNFWERLTNAFMYNVIVMQTKYYIRCQDKYIEQYFGTGYPNSNDIIRDLDLLLVNMHHSVNGIRPFTPAIVPVAGLHIQDDDPNLPKAVQKWLDESTSGCVYMSFGSMVRIETLPKAILTGIYETFKKLAPVRVLLKIAQPQELPPGLPSNVMTQTWFSQMKVLKHKNLKAFVTHGGLGSTQESLSAGVPMIGVPLFGDQHINVRSQVRRNIATMVDIKNFDTNAFYSAVKEVLGNPIYKKNAEEVARDFFDRPMSPMDEATFWVEYIVRHGKQSLKSPVVDMPWYQAHMIDVYGFVLLVLVVACYVVKAIVRKILRLFCSSSSAPGKKKKRE
ncbi:UDP-glucuronosyltransferase 2A3-like [Copidosoma floridanum]|uniref:UDP-glucuronosyltransferase 2A3-like n=1 Tax=Copidosoma floridanum TaxID=29053 RepID=UPI0006C9C1E0|nr:UDP-glucuronosyltransferase 2A3-like [Copidosoma floridanum]